MKTYACIVGQSHTSVGATEATLAKFIEELRVQRPCYTPAMVALVNVCGNLDGIPICFSCTMRRSICVTYCFAVKLRHQSCPSLHRHGYAPREFIDGWNFDLE